MSESEKKIDLNELKRKNPPLGKVMEALSEGSTTRDSPKRIIEDVSLVLTARDNNSKLAKALDELNESLKTAGANSCEEKEKAIIENIDSSTS